MTAVIGIDPGLTGALCLLGPDRFEIVDMPVANGVDPYQLGHILIGWGPVDRVCVEKVGTNPAWGRAASFAFGDGFGVLRGALAILERPVVYVSSPVWTRDLGVGRDKDVHRRRAMDRWPQHAQLFARKKDDGRADAALIALWCAEQMKTAVA